MDVKSESLTRLVRVGQGSSRFPDNQIKTTRYKWYNFLPYNLLGQMKTASNIYFFVG